MSTQTSRETDEDAKTQPEPSCGTNLTGSGTGWTDRPAGAYPPTYPNLCSHEDCFGEIIPDEDWNDDHTADFDHTEITDTLICSDTRGSTRRMHLPDSVEVDDGE